VEAAPLTPALAAETAAALADARASAEAREGMRSFLEKRKPGWQ
jgi:methylglutaconyl-CoA hydratase